MVLGLSDRQIEVAAGFLTGMKGYVYAVRLPGSREVKIGRTQKTPEQRCKELSGTNMTEKFRLEYSLAVRDSQAVEKAAHSLLADCRVLKNREFFRCNKRRAKAAIRNAAIEVQWRWVPKSIRRFFSALQGLLVILSVLLLAGFCLFVYEVMNSGASVNSNSPLSEPEATTPTIRPLPK